MGSTLTYAALPPDVRRVAAESLGSGVLRSWFTDLCAHHVLMEISDGCFVGFALYHFEQTRLSPDADVVSDPQGVLAKGVVDCVCVAPPYRGGGFGRRLTFGALLKMSAVGVRRIETMLKVPHAGADVDHDVSPGVPCSGSPQFWTNLGFRKVGDFPGVFADMSRSVVEYDCAMCHCTPDVCDGVLFAVDDVR